MHIQIYMRDGHATICDLCAYTFNLNLGTSVLAETTLFKSLTDALCVWSGKYLSIFDVWAAGAGI